MYLEKKSSAAALYASHHHRNMVIWIMARPTPGAVKAKQTSKYKLTATQSLWLFIVALVLLQTWFLYLNASTIAANTSIIPQQHLSDRPLRPSSPSDSTDSSSNPKSNHIASYWWPSPSTSGGFLSAIQRFQHSADCSSRDTKYLVLRSLQDSANDNRGLSAWASVVFHHFLHAASDGDDARLGRRILLHDDGLWPMARNCSHGPETRECYFEPLSNCRLSDVDNISDGSVAILSNAKEDYNRSKRTVYTSPTAKYARMVKDHYSWSGLEGEEYPKIALVAAFLAFYMQPKPWLRDEIDARLRRSLPPDLNPDRTIGVPIRRSDKCHGHTIVGSASGELDCPPLGLYLDQVQRFINFDPFIDTVIVTSEDSSATSDFTFLLQTNLPSLRIITNKDDVQQGTGSASQLESYKPVKNANVIASALTSLHMHLRARYFVLTTKSSWTSTIAILARVYGFAFGEVLVIDVGPTAHGFSALAKFGGSDKL